MAGAVSLGTDSELYALREAGRRMADQLNLAIVANGLAATGRWMAFHLEDGSGPGTIYDTRHAAAWDRRNDSRACWYEQLRPAGYSADECALTIQYARAMPLLEAGAPAPILPVRSEDAARKVRQLKRARHRR